MVYKVTVTAKPTEDGFAALYAQQRIEVPAVEPLTVGELVDGLAAIYPNAGFDIPDGVRGCVITHVSRPQDPERPATPS